MKLTSEKLKKIISEELEKLDEMHDMNMPAGDHQFSLVLDFKKIIDKYPGITFEQAKTALNAAFSPYVMQESKKRNK